MNVGSLFSGIGGIDLGLERAGMRVVFQAEADEWRRAVLRSHWPDIPCYEDVRRVRVGEPASRGSTDAVRQAVDDGGREAGAGLPDSVDLLCGGFPCQDLSVAGRRAGLIDGARSSLFFEFARIADAFRPRWLLIENVPGLLSSNSGRDFAVVLSTLADLGYGVAWRVLDSRHFGVPQRRRRVFVVGHLGADGAAPFLPFLEGGGGDSAEGGEAGAEPAVASLSGLGSGGPDDNDGQGGWLVTAPAIVSRYGKGTDSDATDTLITAGTVRSHMRPGSNSCDSVVAAPLSHGSNPNSNAAGRWREDDENLVAYPLARRGRDGGSELEVGEEGTYNALRAGNGGSSRLPQALIGNAVRRLTPTECCRLQGFPDDWLGTPNEPPDSPRYAALGDAVTVNVAEWIGRRILEADQLLRERAA